MLTNIPRRIALFCTSLAVIGLVGCDSSTGVGGGDLSLQGTVTDEAGYSKTAAAQAAVEGAAVTAASVSADGTLNQLEGEATTNAEGRFSLEVDDASDEMIVVALKAGFESRAMVFTNGRSNVTTMPLTAESEAEANVYVEARRTDDTRSVTMSDVAAYVTSDVAAEIRSGARAAAEIAASIAADARARTEYVREESGADEAEDAQENEKDAFFELQADLAAAVNAEQRTAAMNAFERALVEGYTDAGVSVSTQAKARQSGRAALQAFGSSTFEMRKQAAVLASLATAQAVEASFEAAGASNARLSALAQARETLIAEIRAAGSTGAIAAAEADYEQTVEAELAAEADIELSVLASASTAFSAAKTALNLAVTTAGSAAGVAQAYVDFYAAAESTATSSLSGATSKASMAAEVLVLLAAD